MVDLDPEGIAAAEPRRPRYRIERFGRDFVIVDRSSGEAVRTVLSDWEALVLATDAHEAFAGLVIEALQTPRE